MDDYFKKFREMLSLRSLTDHTVMSYSTYIRVYLEYLATFIQKRPEKVSLAELREFIRWPKETFHGFSNAIEYLGRYIHKIAISNSRILSVTESKTIFSTRGRKRGNSDERSRWRTKNLFSDF